MRKTPYRLKCMAGAGLFLAMPALASAPFTGPPIFTSSNVAYFDVGVANRFTITTAGSPTPTLTAASELPASISFHDNGDGTATLAGTPESWELVVPEPPLFDVVASNGPDRTAMQRISVILRRDGLWRGPASTDFVMGVPHSVTVWARTWPLSNLSAAGALPAGVTVHDVGNGSMTISGTAQAGTQGIYPLTLKALSGLDAKSVDFTLNVFDAPELPALQPWSALLAVMALGLLGGVMLRRRRVR